jgi:hypothetical protein
VWVKAAIDEWKIAAGVAEGALFPSINKTGRVWGAGMTPKSLWEIVREAASRAGIEKLALHDEAELRQTLSPRRRRTRPDSVPARTRLDPDNRALPRVQAKLRVAVNDRMGIEPEDV